jgi:hypothetical protein
MHFVPGMNGECALRAVGIASLVAAVSACAAAPLNKPIELGPVASGPGTLAEARKYLEGRWALESFELRPPAGQALIPLKGTGVLNYDDFGNLRIEIRADQASSDTLRAAGLDIRDGVISTDGRTAIDIQRKTLTYFVEGQPAASGGPLSMSRPRHWEVTADTLTLTTRDDAGAPMSVSRWKRSP